GVFMEGPRERSKDGAWAWERGAHLGRAPSRQGSGEPARTRPGRGLPYRFAAALAAIGVGGSPARGPWPRAATRLSTASAAIARRVAWLALPTCGLSTMLRSASSRGLTRG